METFPKSNEISLVTQRYLKKYRCILQEMIQEMTSAKLSDSISYNFMVQMIPHHRAAIEMCRNLLQYTTCIPLQEIAEGIITEQTQSIHDMERILCHCERQRNSCQDLSCYQNQMNRIMESMFDAMENACSDNRLNADFMREMIPHHRGAVEMSRNALSYHICPGLIPILNAILVSQERGICQMEKLLKEIERND